MNGRATSDEHEHAQEYEREIEYEHEIESEREIEYEIEYEHEDGRIGADTLADASTERYAS